MNAKAMLNIQVKNLLDNHNFFKDSEVFLRIAVRSGRVSSQCFITFPMCFYSSVFILG